MKWSAFVIVIMVILSIFAGILINSFAGESVHKRSIQSLSSSIKTLDTVRAIPHLDWNGSFPYNLQALPFIMNGKVNVTAVGDVNGDGKVDVIFSSTDNDKIFVYFNRGTYTSVFPSLVLNDSDGINEPVDVSVVDGLLAVASHVTTASSTAETDTVKLYNLTSGKTMSLKPPSGATGVDYEITSLAVGDFNGDGKEDIAAAFSVNGTLSPTLKSKINIYFSPFTDNQTANETISVDGNIEKITAGNFRSVGEEDIAAVVNNRTDVLVFYPDSSGDFDSNDYSEHPVNYATTICAHDLNNDGIDELIVGDSGTGNVSIYNSNGGGDLPKWPSLNITGDSGVSAIAVGNFNPDAYPDIVVARKDVLVDGHDVPLNLRIYDGPWNFNGESISTPSRTIFAGYNVLDMKVADINGDGMDDLITCDYGGLNDYPSVPYVLYQRDGYLKGIADESLYGGLLPMGIAIGDINGDSLNDIVVAQTKANETGVFLNDGYGFPRFYSAVNATPGNPGFVALSNISNAYRDDIVVSHLHDGNLTLYSSSGDVLTLRTYMNTTYMVLFGDTRNESESDILVNSLTNPEIDIFLGAGFSNDSLPQVRVPLFNVSRDFSLINVMGEQYPELVVMYSTNITIYRQNTVSNFTPVEVIPNPSGYNGAAVAVGDFNGDGRDDLLAIYNSNTSFKSMYAIYPQNGGTIQNTSYISGNLTGRVRSVTVGDFNDDGVPDFAAVTNYNMVVVAYNDGSVFNYDYFATDPNPVYIASGDVNGDGKDDIVVSTDGPMYDASPAEVDMVDVYYQKDTKPIANISGPKEIYEGHYLNLSAENSTDTLSDISSLNYTWYVKNGSEWSFVSYGVNLSYFVKTQGNYTFMVVVRDKEGLSDNATKNVTVLDTVPVVNFTYYNAVEGQNTTFHANISAYDGVYEIKWDMNGDGIWDFYNTTWVNYTYTENGTYHVNLTVIDGDGSIGYVNKTVFIKDTVPTCNFSYSPKVIYEGEAVSFTASWKSYDPVVNWTWFISDNVLYGEDINYTFQENGTYTVTLQVRDSDGSVANSSKKLVVLDTQPTVNFTYSPQVVYEGESVNFTAHVESYDKIKSYFWDFGDGNYSTDKNPTHAFNKNGTYTVTLYVTDADGSNVSTSRVIVVKDVKPSVTLAYTNAVEGENTTFYVNITSYDGIKYVVLYFGDGKEVNITNPPNHLKIYHMYVRNGSYEASVFVMALDGDQASDAITVVVEDTLPRVVLRVVGLSVVKEDERVELSANGTTAYDGIKEYLWDFNYVNNHFTADKSTEVPYTFTSFPERGNYTVAVMVIDGDGSGALGFAKITVVNVPPVANFTYNITDNVVYVDGSHSYDTPSDKASLIYMWNFGDGSHVVYGMTAEHEYKKPGKYVITLIVKDNDGAESKMSKVIEIKTVPVTNGGTAGKTIGLILLILIPIIGGLLAALIYMRGKQAIIDDVYLISDSGLLIHHSTRRLKPDMDEDVLSSMLVAIQEFVKDAFKGETDVSLKSMDFGNKKIQIHRGKHLFLAVVSNRDVPKKLAGKISSILNDIEEKYGKVLENWDGDVSAFRGVEEILKKIWE